MKNNLLVIFENSLFKSYDNIELINYFNFFNKKLHLFVNKLDLRLFIAVDKNYIESYKNLLPEAHIVLYNKSIKSIFESYKNEVHKYDNNENPDFTLIVSASYPFFSFEKNEFILKDSEKYLVDYYYGENFPEGIVGEVINNAIIDELIKLSKDEDIYHQNAVFDILLRNISSFDIDLIEGFDYYLPYRISLSLSEFSSLPLIYEIIFSNKNKQKIDTKNSADKVISSEKEIGDKKEISRLKNLQFFSEFNDDSNNIQFIEWDFIEEKLRNLEILYTLPKTYIIEISSKCNYSCIHCLNPKGLKRNSDFIDKSMLFEFINKNKIYFKDANFIIGGFGEPFMHKDFYEIIDFLSMENKVYIETNGSFLNNDFFTKLKNPDNVILIISIDSIKEETYRSLGKKMILSLLLNTCLTLLEKYPQNVYLSYLRIPQNDDELESFFSYFQKYEKNIIFKKYNSYSKKLDNLEIADLTPVERFPCYHLRRDIFILSDGRISVCYSDFNGELFDLNVKNSLEMIFEKMKELYKNHCKNSYIDLCKDCNEFYTYFF